MAYHVRVGDIVRFESEFEFDKTSGRNGLTGTVIDFEPVNGWTNPTIAWDRGFPVDDKGGTERIHSCHRDYLTVIGHVEFQNPEEVERWLAADPPTT